MRRISIAGVLGIVALVAIGLAALIRATELWADATFTLMMVLLLGSVVGLILRSGRRAGWVGFAVFGWGFFVIGNLPAPGIGPYPTDLPDACSHWVFETSNPKPAGMANPLIVFHLGADEARAFEEEKQDYNLRHTYARMIGRWLWALMFGCVGAIFGVFLARPRRASDHVDASTSGTIASSRR